MVSSRLVALGRQEHGLTPTSPLRGQAGGSAVGQGPSPEVDSAGLGVCLGGSQRGGAALRYVHMIYPVPQVSGSHVRLLRAAYNSDFCSLLPVWPQDALVVRQFSPAIHQALSETLVV